MRPPKEVDIESGFDKRIAASKPNNIGGHGAVRGVQKPIAPHGDMKSFEMRLGPEGVRGHGAVRGQMPVAYGDHMKSFEVKIGPEGKFRTGP